MELKQTASNQFSYKTCGDKTCPVFRLIQE